MSLNKIPVLLVAFFLAGGAFAQASTSVDIRWIGPYTAESTTSIGDASMLLGARSQSEGTKSLESTTLISVELTPFHGHLIVLTEGVQSVQTAHPQAALSGAISSTDG